MGKICDSGSVFLCKRSNQKWVFIMRTKVLSREILEYLSCEAPYPIKIQMGHIPWITVLEVVIIKQESSKYRHNTDDIKIFGLFPISIFTVLKQRSVQRCTYSELSKYKRAWVGYMATSAVPPNKQCASSLSPFLTNTKRGWLTHCSYGN